MFEDESGEVSRPSLRLEAPAKASVSQPQEIVSLLRAGLTPSQVAERLRVPLRTVSAHMAHLSRGTYGENSDPAAEVEGENEVAGEAFGLERDLQLALRRSIEQLEPGLTIIDGDREQVVEMGRIDITARDRDGTTVVIELKAGTADHYAIGQILVYMGNLMDGTSRLRGIIVAREFSNRAIAAARAVPNIRLVRYGFQFSFATVGTISPDT